jgi:hypothetical protein
VIAAPPGLIGASLLFWGWQTGNVLVGAALGAVIEGMRHIRARFDLGAAEHARIADFCTVLFVGTAGVLAVNRGVSEGILLAFQWLPAALAPILVAQFVSASGRVPLSALFRYLRKLKRHDPATSDPLVDTSAVFAAVVLIAAGVANHPGPGYYAGVVLVVAWGLWARRPAHAGIVVWALMLGAGVGAGYAGHAGLVRAQAALENWVSDWLLRGYTGDPYRSTTDIGAIGRLKLHDTIVLRVFAPPGAGGHPPLLHLASYNTYVGTTWLARAAPMQPVKSEAGGLNWRLEHLASQSSARIAARVERGRIVLPLPSDTVRVTGLAAKTVQRNALGAVYAEVAGDWVQYEADIAAAAETSGPPVAADRALPPAERATFSALADRLGLRGLPFAEARRRIEDYFRGYAYRTWRDRPTPPGMTPLGEFVRETHAGHCEYFGAATTLLLRAAGIPARYATGFAVLEYSALEGAWVVRARHAHAWSRAWDGARWVDLDTTPPVWFAEEARLAPSWEKLADLVRWAGFRWSQRGEIRASDGWYALLAALVAILAWRLLRGRRVARAQAAERAAPRAWPGADSEFALVERSLAARGLPRTPGTALGAWRSAIAAALPAELRPQFDEALELHQRYRFDPQGLDRAARERLRALCAALRTAE